MLGLNRQEILTHVQEWQKDGLKIGFTSGVFDILHSGHIHYLEEAKKKCDKLIVAVNRDSSVKINKGEKRPINKEKDRLKIIASLKMVNLAFLFEEINNQLNITEIKPHFYFKSDQYSLVQLTSHKILKKWGGKTILINNKKNYASSNIINTILRKYSDERPLMEKLNLEKRPAIFLDRDGVINEEIEYLHEEENFKVLPQVYLALKKLQDKKFKLIIVTTQAGIGLGYFKKEDFFRVNKKMLNLFNKKNIILDKVYYCPHTKADKCTCRKPGTLLFERASLEAGIDLKKSYIIGDKTSDIKTGENIGLATILVKTGHAGQDNEFTVSPDYVANNLNEAADWIIQNQL